MILGYRGAAVFLWRARNSTFVPYGEFTSSDSAGISVATRKRRLAPLRRLWYE